LLGADLLGRVVRTVREHAPRVRELTVEANPDSLSDGVLDAMAAAGATRLSVGVQSLCDDELVALGRLHTAAQAQGRVLAAVRRGLDVSVDLMCAIQRQTDASWRLTLQKVLELGVGHVSVYPLQIEEETPLGRLVGDDEPAWHDGEVQATRMELAEDLLTGAGFHRYEVASYALPDKECQHNQRYWTGRPYLGLGLGASSMLTREGYEALRGVCPQLPRVGDGVERIRLGVRGARAESLPTLAQTGFDLEFLDGAQAAAEDLMLGMRMSVGVDKGLLEHARRVLGSDEVNAAFEACARRGLIQWAEGRYAPTHEGWLLGNELYGTLWDLAPGEVVQSRALVQKPAV
jgi:oxygen-independent coproporphyrinogen-3 oxidase